MPSPTLAATGNLGRSIVNMAYLVASSANFQTLTGAINATEALAFVHCEADDTSDTTALRPRALVFPATYRREKTSNVAFFSQLGFHLAFEFLSSDGYLDNIWDQRIEFMNRVDSIIADMETKQGDGSAGYHSPDGQLSYYEMSLESGPDAILETKRIGGEEVSEYFWAVSFGVAVIGK